MKTKIEKDIETTIKLLRYLTHGEGYAGISVFDIGAGGGFSIGKWNVNLERSGLIGKEEKYTVEEFKNSILSAIYPYSDKLTAEELDEKYKKRKWND